MYAMREQITSLIEGSQVVVLSGETGSGKTTQVGIPSFLGHADTQNLISRTRRYNYSQGGRGPLCHGSWMACARPGEAETHYSYGPLPLLSHHRCRSFCWTTRSTRAVARGSTSCVRSLGGSVLWGSPIGSPRNGRSASPFLRTSPLCQLCLSYGMSRWLRQDLRFLRSFSIGQTEARGGRIQLHFEK